MESFSILIDLLKKQDKRALELLYDQYGKKFYSYCVSQWRLSEDQAWDIVYQTLETLVEKAGNYTFSSKNEFDKFSTTVVLNFLRQWYRKNKAASYRAATLMRFDEQEGASNPIVKEINKLALREFENEEEVENPKMEVLAKALSMLEESERELLLLRARSFTYDEIAGFMGIDNAQLKVKHHRAKQKLIRFLQAQLSEHGK